MIRRVPLRRVAVATRPAVFGVTVSLVLAVALFSGPAGVVGLVDASNPGEPTGPTDTPDHGSENRTDRHQNPASYGEAGDAEALAEWYELRLVDRLNESAALLREGAYARSNQTLGERFWEQHAAYEDVAATAGREETATLFEEIRNEQAAMTSLLASYEESMDEYDSAIEAGDDELARERARELESLSTEINASKETISDQYDELEGNTDANFSDVRESVDEATEELRGSQADIRREAFELTALTVRARSTQISYSDPLRARGTLVSESGEPVADDEITLEVGNQTLTTRTDARGRFTVTYRPISVYASTESLSVTYRPNRSSPYLGSRTSVPVSIDRETPTIEVPTSDAASIAFGDEFAVSTDVTLGGEPVDGLPLNVSLGGTVLGTAETTDGSVELSQTLPADIADGHRTLAASVPFEGRAIAPASASTTVRVEPTTPSLSIDHSQRGDELAVSGSLSGDGHPIVDRSITIAIDDRATTVTTAGDGTFTTTVPAPTTVGEHTVSAALDGSGTNLESVETAETLTVTAPSAASITPRLVVLLAAVGAVLVPLTTRWWRRRRETRRTAIESRPQSSVVVASTPERSRPDQLFDRAVGALDAMRVDEAVQTAYAAVRRQLESGVDDRDGLTHWEFYRAYEASSDTHADRLATLTATYERATFEPVSVGPDAARRALSCAEALCDSHEDPAGRYATTEPPDDRVRRRDHGRER
ncbi:DUF4129 domain-containing protein [Halovivax cerinus]|uniref:DUF4129 domain-containing protein n=1 Tax=Halovivax cerinus TaxID=1487865 RepID=A0ABD5NQY9_9EURY|nr:DUF4129 domain-containing protein [Halovivax cerinus]